MVSALWKTASDGDLGKVKELLTGASSVEIEIKDHTGVTPLIQAVKNGHVDVVRELLAAGADPTNSSSQGRPETYTEDPVILECLGAAQITQFVNRDMSSSENPAHGGSATYESPENGYSQDPAVAAGYDPAAFRGYYYMPPPPDGMYPPYAYMQNPEGMQPMQGYYPPPPPQHQQQQQPTPSSPQMQRREREGSNGVPNLPPADIARQIPCRYYPMCKYGPSCLFAHPPPQFFNGPPPPAPHYPGPYDPHAPPPSFPPAGYYGMPPPHSFPPPPHSAMNGMNPNGVVSAAGPPPPPQQQVPSIPSPHAAPFTPSGAPSIPPQVPYYTPPPNGAMPMIPQHVSIPSNVPYLPHPQSVMPGPQPFPPTSPTHHRKESFAQQQQQQPQQLNGSQPQANGFDENHNPKSFGEDGAPTHHRDGSIRRGGFRRNSFGGRKPPCLFFPTNKCRNGDQCRFPHIRPEDDPEAFGPTGFPPNWYPSRNRNRQNNFGTIHEKGQRNDSSAPAFNGNVNGHVNGHVNGFGKHSPRSEQNNYLPHKANGARPDKLPRNGFSPSGPKQRVPNADDFPSLSGTTTPPTPLNVNGPTAAQVLKGSASKDVLKGATDKLEESMAKVSLEPNVVNGVTKDSAPDKSIRRASSHDIMVPTFASISANAPKLVGTAA